MTCPNCGNQLSVTTGSCPFCNTPLNFQEQQPTINYNTQTVPTYVNEPAPEIIKPKKSSNVGAVIGKIFGGLLTLFVLILLFIFFTTKHLYCTKGSEKLMIFYTDKRLFYCLNLFGSEDQCKGFDEAKKLVNEGNIKAVIDGLKDAAAEEGYRCKLN